MKIYLYNLIMPRINEILFGFIDGGNQENPVIHNVVSSTPRH